MKAMFSQTSLLYTYDVTVFLADFYVEVCCIITVDS